MINFDRLVKAIFQYWIAIFVLGLVAIIVAYLLFIESSGWTSVHSAGIQSTKEIVLQQLAKRLNDRKQIIPGSFEALISIKKPNRSWLTIYTAEADFLPKAIDGIANWSRLLASSATLVNSVDEQRRNNGGISTIITEGCGLTSIPENGEPLQIGDVDWERCQSDRPYYGLGFRQVADVAIILWRNDPVRARCKLEAANIVGDYATDKEYIDCVKDSLKKALSNLLSRSSTGEQPNTLVVPLLAGGVGAMHPGYIYGAYGDILKDKLSSNEAAEGLPDRIILLTSRRWNAERVAANDSELAILTRDLQRWWGEKSLKFQQTDSLANLFGVLLGLLAIALVTAYREQPQSDGTYRLSPDRFLLTLIGWGLAAQGALSTITTVLGRLAGSFGLNILTNVIFGLAAIVVAWIIGVASQSFDEFRRR